MNSVGVLLLMSQGTGCSPISRGRIRQFCALGNSCSQGDNGSSRWASGLGAAFSVLLANPNQHLGVGPWSCTPSPTHFIPLPVFILHHSCKSRIHLSLLVKSLNWLLQCHHQRDDEFWYLLAYISCITQNMRRSKEKYPVKIAGPAWDRKLRLLDLCPSLETYLQTQFHGCVYEKTF